MALGLLDNFGEIYADHAAQIVDSISDLLLTPVVMRVILKFVQEIRISWLPRSVKIGMEIAGDISTQELICFHCEFIHFKPRVHL